MKLISHKFPKNIKLLLSGRKPVILLFRWNIRWVFENMNNSWKYESKWRFLGQDLKKDQNPLSSTINIECEGRKKLRSHLEGSQAERILWYSTFCSKRPFWIYWWDVAHPWWKPPAALRTILKWDLCGEKWSQGRRQGPNHGLDFQIKEPALYLVDPMTLKGCWKVFKRERTWLLVFQVAPSVKQSGPEKDEVKSPASWLYYVLFFSFLTPPPLLILLLCVGVVAQLCPTLCNPMDCSLPGSSVHGIPREEYWSGLPCPPLGDLPDPRIEPGSSALQADSFTIWATREAYADSITVSQKQHP